MRQYKHREARMDDTDSDVIECSISETDSSKKIKPKKIGKPKIKNFKNQEKIIVKNSSDFKCSNITNYSRLRNNTLSMKQNCILKLKDSSKTTLHHFSNSKITSEEERLFSNMKTPDDNLLSKSKLKNIQHWLQNNNFDTFQTPPFANLSITPVKFNTEQELLEKLKTFENESSSLDSDVEGVLKAVYGDEWMQKYSDKKSKTEPKKCLNKNFLTLSEVKNKTVTSAKSVRRNILMNYNKSVSNQIDDLQLDLNESITSGFRLINFNESHENINTINTNTQLQASGQDKFKGKKHYQKTINLPSLNENLQNGKPLLNSGHKIIKAKKPTQKMCKIMITSIKKTFLESLSISTPTSECHSEAQYYKRNFNSKKDELIKVLYKLFNSEVFDEKLPHDMNFSWNVKLRETAGYCYNKRITKSTGKIVRVSRIEFSSKIIDRADRLRDTMIHELCHAASWVIEGKLDGHGPTWYSWASKAMSRFPELPLIKRCHNYDIVAKYIYKCTSCGYCIKRHSKSLDVEKKRCGHCFGVFKLYFNKKRKGATEIPQFNATTTLPTPNKFALFVKDNYHIIRSETKNAKHAEIMKILSQKYSCTKKKIAS